MSDIYKEWPHINSLPISERIKEIRETVKKMLDNGQSVESLKDVAGLYEEKELYEAAEAVLSAIKEFENNKENK